MGKIPKKSRFFLLAASLTWASPTKGSLHSLIFSLRVTGTFTLVWVEGGTTSISPLAADCNFSFFCKVYKDELGHILV